jgi:putative salt-induced outer membrane protein YdiY
MKRMGILAISLVALASNLYADQVGLKNGDRLTGTITKSDDNTLVLKSEFAGEVTIQWSAVQEISSGQPLHVQLKEGKQIVGIVTTKDGNLHVETKDGKVAAPKDAIVMLRSEAEQTAYEKTLHPSLLQGWNGGSNIGFALTRGNSQTKNLAVAFDATRKTLHDDLILHASSVYATNDAPGATPGTTANAVQGGLRYDRNITARLFGYGSADFQTDDLQNLDLRSVFGGGLGFHAVNSLRTTLDFLGGINYTREKYSTFTRNFPAASIGEEFMHKLHGGTIITQQMYIYPDLLNTGEYRGTFTFGTVTKMNKWMGWQNSFSDIYVSNPPVGKKQNDIIFTTGLSLTFLR